MICWFNSVAKTSCVGRLEWESKKGKKLKSKSCYANKLITFDWKLISRSKKSIESDQRKGWNSMRCKMLFYLSLKLCAGTGETGDRFMSWAAYSSSSSCSLCVHSESTSFKLTLISTLRHENHREKTYHFLTFSRLISVTMKERKSRRNYSAAKLMQSQFIMYV